MRKMIRKLLRLFRPRCCKWCDEGLKHRGYNITYQVFLHPLLTNFTQKLRQRRSLARQIKILRRSSAAVGHWVLDFLQVFVRILTNDVAVADDPSTQNRNTVERHDHKDQHPKHAWQSEKCQVENSKTDIDRALSY